MADKIVSWGGIDSKGTSGMGVTGSFQVSSSANSFFVGGGNVGINTSGSTSRLTIAGGNLSNGVDNTSILLIDTTQTATYSPSIGFPFGLNIIGTYTDTNTANNTIFRPFINVDTLISSSTNGLSSPSRIFTNISPSVNVAGRDINNITRIFNISSTFTARNVNNITGIYYNPTFTLTGANNNHIAIETVTGDVLFNTTSGNTLIGSSVSNTAKLSVKGSGATSSTTSFLVQNANASASLQVTDDRVVNLIGGSTLKISSPLSSAAPIILSNNGAAGGYRGGYDFKSGANGSEGVTAFRITSANTTGTLSYVGIGNLTESDVAGGAGKLQIENNLSGGRNAAIKLRVNFADIVNQYNGIQFDTIENGSGGAFFGSQRNTAGTGYGADLAIFTTVESPANTYTETARFVGKSQALSLGAGITPNAKLHISGSSGSALLEIDSPTQNNILHVSGSGRVGIGKATDYALEIANTSSLLVSATGWTPTTFSTASAAVSITPNIYVTAGNRSYYSLYVANPGITISGSFGNYDFRSLYAAGKIDAVGGINAGDSRFYATSNAVSFQGYNPYDGNTGGAAGGITFTSRQVAGGDEAGIGAYYGAGSRLYIYNKYNASDSKIIFSVGGTIRSSFFGTGNLSIGNGETDMSARLGVKGSGTTSSTTALLVQNANSRTSFIVNDDGRVGINTTPYDAFALSVDPISGSTVTYVAQRAAASSINEYRFGTTTGTPSAGNTAGRITWQTLSFLEGIYTSAVVDGYRTVDLLIQGWSGSVAETARFTYDNKVGIGTTSPSAKLHVAGNTIITGSLTVSSTTVGAAENTLTLGLAPAGGAGEGGQLGFNATGGTYTSASFIDLWQNKLRVLKGTNVGSTAEVANFDLQTLYLNLPGGAVTMPQRPAFRVTGSSGYNPTADTVISGSSVGIDYNQGGYYNNTNGEFTCPVAGLYHVWYVGRTYAASLASVALYKNNTGTPLAFWESNANSGHFGTSAVVSLAVNDIITAKVTAGQVTFDGNDNWGAAYIG